MYDMAMGQAPTTDPGTLHQFIPDNGLYSRIIDCLPYPVIVFSPDHTLVMANRVFTEVAGLYPADLEKGNIRILRYRIRDLKLACAVRRVFDGTPILLEDIMQPFDMFSGIRRDRGKQMGDYSKAGIFRVPDGDGKTGHAAIMFMP